MFDPTNWPLIGFSGLLLGAVIGFVIQPTWAAAGIGGMVGGFIGSIVASYLLERELRGGSDDSRAAGEQQGEDRSQVSE